MCVQEEDGYAIKQARGRKDFSDVPYGNLQELYTEYKHTIILTLRQLQLVFARLLERYRKAEQEKEDLAQTSERRMTAYVQKEKQVLRK